MGVSLTAMRNRSAFWIAVPALAVLCLPAAGLSQSADLPAATLKVQAREVLLPVTVRDKKGALVTSLNAVDFTLTEDGRPQKIKSFTRESNQPYRIGLLVDTSRSLSGALEDERKAAGKFVDTMLPADPKTGKDQAFLIHFDREVELLEDFTTSRSKLHNELDGLGPTASGSRDDPQGPETTGDERTGGRSDGRGGTQLFPADRIALSGSQAGPCNSTLLCAAACGCHYRHCHQLHCRLEHL